MLNVEICCLANGGSLVTEMKDFLMILTNSVFDKSVKYWIVGVKKKIKRTVRKNVNGDYIFVFYMTIQIQKQADSVVSDTNGLLISDFGSWRHEGRETQFLKAYANHTMLTPTPRAAHLVMFKISIHLCRSGPEKLNHHRNGRKLNSLPQVDSLPQLDSQLTRFQNPQILRTISSGHDVIHTPAHLLSGCLLWQLWLSYPLHASVNCTNWLCIWALSPTKLNNKI